MRDTRLDSIMLTIVALQTNKEWTVDIELSGVQLQNSERRESVQKVRNGCYELADKTKISFDPPTTFSLKVNSKRKFDDAGPQEKSPDVDLPPCVLEAAHETDAQMLLSPGFSRI